MKLLITGGCGFIGSNFIRKVIEDVDVEYLINLDLLTYASNKKYVEPFYTNRKYTQELGVDIGDVDAVSHILKFYEIDTVVNFAAETHVDNSISDPTPFVNTNVEGTFNLLRACQKTWPVKYEEKTFVHISTDEVYGALTSLDGQFTLDMPYKPNSPYSATKASSDLLCRAFFQTYGFPVIVTNCCNNYGPNQHVEKLIPLTISRLKHRDKIPVYGKGQNIREWIYVDDHCDAIREVMKYGKHEVWKTWRSVFDW